jgi:hypothetical protein
MRVGCKRHKLALCDPLEKHNCSRRGLMGTPTQRTQAVLFDRATCTQARRGRLTINGERASERDGGDGCRHLTCGSLRFPPFVPFSVQTLGKGELGDVQHNVGDNHSTIYILQHSSKVRKIREVGRKVYLILLIVLKGNRTVRAFLLQKALKRAIRIDDGKPDEELRGCLSQSRSLLCERGAIR